MKNTKLCNRIINVNERRTSMRLCVAEWDALKEICKKEKTSRNLLIEFISKYKAPELGLSYATRLFITHYFQSAATDTGHRLAGHGRTEENHQTLVLSIKNLFNS